MIEGKETELDRLLGQRISAGDHCLAGDDRRQGRQDDQHGANGLGRHQEEPVGILPFHDRRVEARPRLATTVPVLETRSPSGHAENIEVFEARKVRDEGDVGQGVVVTGEPLVGSKGLFHLIEEENHALDRDEKRLIRRAYSISCGILDEQTELLDISRTDWLEFYIVLVRTSSKPEAPALTASRGLCRPLPLRARFYRRQKFRAGRPCACTGYVVRFCAPMFREPRSGGRFPELAKRDPYRARRLAAGAA